MSAPSKDLLVGPDPDAWKLFVFRKSRDLLSTLSLIEQLRAEIESLTGGGTSAIDALVRAGEIETGLADASSPAAVRMAALVDLLAAAVCASSFDRHRLLQSLQEVAVQDGVARHIHCSHPEGFSYYGLNPLDFADLARNMHHQLRPNVAVIGIRSIGSTLGAVIAASLRGCFKRVDRITVRPQGEPYLRTVTFDGAQSQWIATGLQQQADFVVADEGPGFSGSTFLSVAKALAGLGVPASRIVLMGSRPFSQRAGADDGEAWDRFGTYTIDYGRHVPEGAGRSLGDGAWRELLYQSHSQWPACWVEQERIKHLSRDDSLFLKFEGFGRYGELSRRQAANLADAGFSSRLLGFNDGFAKYEFVRGRPLTNQDLNGALLSRMAAYCAFRVKHCAAANPNPAMLHDMVRVNLNVEFDLEAPTFDLPLERPVYADCRMLAHEWLRTVGGRVLKTDSVGHGEGHQLPGPVDIAWDLAGTILEWKLSSTETEFFLEEYRHLSGDDAAARVRQYMLPYAVSRMAHCRMAAAAMKSRDEAKHLHRLYKHYAQQVKVILEYRPKRLKGVSKVPHACEL